MIQDRPSWTSRPAVVAVIAFAIGAAVAGVIVAFVMSRGDDNNSTAQATATPGTATGTPVTTGTPIGPTATPLNPRNADDALANYIQQTLHQTYIGPCPQAQSGQTPQGTCSKELYRSTDVVTFALGPAFSEAVGEAVLTPAENGVWTVDFVGKTSKPPALGGRPTVYGAGDCLNLHSAPSKSSPTLTCKLDGTTADVIGGPQVADGITWWQLKDLGWGSQEFLEASD